MYRPTTCSPTTCRSTCARAPSLGMRVSEMINTSVSLSGCPSVFLSVFLSVSVYLSCSVSVCLFLPMPLSVWLSVYLPKPMSLFMQFSVLHYNLLPLCLYSCRCQSLCPSLCLSLCPCPCLSILFLAKQVLCLWVGLRYYDYMITPLARLCTPTPCDILKSELIPLQNMLRL